MREEEQIAAWEENEENKKKIQPKADSNRLEISQPEDAAEKEADEVAKHVVEGSTSNVKGSKNNSTISTKSEGNSALYVDDKLQRSLDSSKGSGQTMDDSVKGEMESKMGADFSGVKIHTGSHAHEMSEDINAKAFTHGQDIYFKNGNYDPGSDSGKNLLAHELHHTVQNGDGVNRKVFRQVAVPIQIPTFKAENIKPDIPYGYIEIYAGYERTLKDVTQYYGLEYESIKKVNQKAYDSIFNSELSDATAKADPRATFDFDKSKLRANYSVFIPAQALLNHRDPLASKSNFGSFKSHYFTKANNSRLAKILSGEEQIEVGESDPNSRGAIAPLVRNTDKESPWVGEMQVGISQVNAKGRIYPIQEALLFLGKIEGTEKALNGDFSEGNRLHRAIEKIQREWKIVPAFSNNPQWKAKTKGTFYGVINAETIHIIDEKLAVYEAALKPYYTYGSKEDKLKGSASSFDFNKYEKGSAEGEQDYTNQDIKLNGDLFNVNVFSRDRAAGGSVMDLRLTYKGEGASEKDMPSMVYFSHTATHGWGSGDPSYQFFFQKPVIEPPRFDLMKGGFEDKNAPRFTFTLPKELGGSKEKKQLPSDGSYRNTLGYSMSNFGGALWVPDNPNGAAPPWQPWFVEIQDILELDESWTPAARVHRFIIRNEYGKNESAMLIIPNLAVRTSDIEKDPNFGVNFDDAAKQDGLTSLKMAIDMYNNVLSVELGLKDYNKGAGIPWLIGDCFMSYNTQFVYDLVVDKQFNKKIDPKKAGALLETMLMAQESLSMHLGAYLSLTAEQQGALDNNLQELLFRWNWATYTIYDNFDEGFAYAVEAKKISKAIEYQMQLLEVREGGGMDARLNRAAQTYFGIKDNTGKPALNAVIEKELFRSQQQLEKNRAKFFHPGDTVENEPEEEDIGLGTDIVIGLIEILSIQHLHDTSEDMIDKSDDYTFIWERVQSSKTEVLAELDRSQSISRIEAGFQKGGVYVQLIANQEIASFYKDVSRTDFQNDINAMIEHIQAVTQANAIFDSILTNVIAFVIAEIVTWGMATVFLPGLIAAEAGIITIRVAGAVRTIRAINLLKSAFSITAFTVIHRQMTEGTGNESKNSFAEDLVSNLVMMGMMGASMKGISNILGKIAPNMGKWGKFGVAQLGALGSLQLFAEAHYLISEGRLMNADERTKSFLSNLGLHFGMMISGLVLSRQLDIVYRKAYSEIFQVEFKTLFGPKFEKMQSNRSELSDLAADMMMKGHVTPEFLDKLGEYFKLEKDLNSSMREQLKTVEGKEGEQLRLEFEKENQRMDQEVQSLVDAMQLKLALLGIQGKKGTNTGLFKVKSDKQLSVKQADLARVRMMLEGEGGVKAKMTEIEKEKMYRVNMADGTVFYLEVEARIQTPFEVVEAKLGAGGWKKASDAFWADEGMKQHEEMKGNAESNQLIKQMVEEGWKPGEPIKEKYREKMKENQKRVNEKSKEKDDQSKKGKNTDKKYKRIHTGAKPGKDKTSETQRQGTVRMEEHDDYKTTIQKVEDLGYIIQRQDFSPEGTKGAEVNTPWVEYIEVTDANGNKRVEKRLNLLNGMRFLDLEHELDHIDQFENKIKEPLFTEKVIENSQGERTENPDQKNIIEDWQLHIIEYEVRLKEMIRLMERNVDKQTLDEHFIGYNEAFQDFFNIGLGKGTNKKGYQFMQKYFPEIPQQMDRYNELKTKNGY